MHGKGIFCLLGTEQVKSITGNLGIKEKYKTKSPIIPLPEVTSILMGT